MLQDWIPGERRARRPALKSRRRDSPEKVKLSARRGTGPPLQLTVVLLPRGEELACGACDSLPASVLRAFAEADVPTRRLPQESACHATK